MLFLSFYDEFLKDCRKMIGNVAEFFDEMKKRLRLPVRDKGA